jgi:hypothetical protein
VDEDTLRAVELLREGKTLREAEAILQKETGDEIDLVALAETLMGQGFVARVDTIATAPAKKGSFSLYERLNRIPSARFRWLHHPATALAVGALVAGWLMLLAFEPSQRPTFRDLHVVDSGAGATVLTFLALFVFANFHELAHFGMARSFGVEASASLSHRMLLLVLQTDVTNAWVLRPAQRLRIFLAGIALNLSVAAAFGVAAIVMAHLDFSSQDGPLRFVRWIAYVNVFPLAFQLFLFAKTDLYYVLEMALKERNLAGDSVRCMSLYARRVWWNLLRKPTVACPTGCGGGLHEDEPFCFKCGRIVFEFNPNRLTIRHAQRWKLLPFGVLMLLGQGVGYYFVVGMVYRIQGQYFVVQMGDFGRAIGDPASASVGAWATVIVLLLAIGLQFLVVLTFALRGVQYVRQLIPKRLRAAVVRAFSSRRVPAVTFSVVPVFSIVPKPRADEARAPEAPG